MLTTKELVQAQQLADDLRREGEADQAALMEKLIEGIEDAEDLVDSRLAMLEPGASVPWEKVKQEMRRLVGLPT